MEPLGEAAVKQLARELLIEVAKGVKFPSHVCQHQTDKGEICFVCVMSSERGTATIFYKPQEAAEYLVRQCEPRAKKISEVFPQVFPNLMSTEEFLRIEAAAAIYTLLNNFHLEFAETLVHLPEISYLQVEFAMNAVWEQAAAVHSGKSPDHQHAIELVDQLLAYFNRGRKARMLQGLFKEIERAKPRMHLLAPIYDSLLPVWKDAKNRYKLNRDSARWRQIIAAAYVEPELPSDLIERFETHQLNTDSYEAMPSVLALEHAARMCGVTPYAYKTRTLQERLADSRKWIAEHSRDELLKEAEKFFAVLCEKERTDELAERMRDAADGDFSLRSKISQNAADEGPTIPQ